MNTYTIVAVNDTTRAWSTKAGAAMKSYRVTLQNKDGRELGNVELSRNASAPPPATGEQVVGEVDRSGQYGPKFQEPRKGGGGGGWKPRSPEERRSIAMQSSLQRGVDMVRIAVENGRIPNENVGELTEHALVASEKFYARVMKADAG